MKYQIKHRVGNEVGIQLRKDNGEDIGALFFTITEDYELRAIFCHPIIIEKLEEQKADVLAVIDNVIQELRRN